MMQQTKEVTYTLDCRPAQYRKLLWQNAKPKVGWLGFTRIVILEFDENDTQDRYFILKRTLIDWLPSNLVEVHGTIQVHSSHQITIQCDFYQHHGIPKLLIGKTIFYSVISVLVWLFFFNLAPGFLCLMVYIVVYSIYEWTMNYMAIDEDQARLHNILNTTADECSDWASP